MQQLHTIPESKETLTVRIPSRIGEMLDSFSMDIGHNKSQTLSIILDYFFSELTEWEGM